MRLIVASIAILLSACGVESEPEETASGGTAAAADIASPAAVSSPKMMAIPDDPDALKRLEAMGYTVHEEQGHLHAPGAGGCPAAGEGRAM